MSTVEEIERAVSKLAPADFAEFQAWFEEFNSDRFDERIEQDAKSGKLDRLAAQARNNLRRGLAREL